VAAGGAALAHPEPVPCRPEVGVKSKSREANPPNMCRESYNGARAFARAERNQRPYSVRDLSSQEAIHEVDSPFDWAHPWRDGGPSAGGRSRGEPSGTRQPRCEQQSADPHHINEGGDKTQTVLKDARG